MSGGQMSGYLPDADSHPAGGLAIDLSGRQRHGDNGSDALSRDADDAKKCLFIRQPLSSVGASTNWQFRCEF